MQPNCSVRIFSGFDWTSIPHGGVLVDVGGGLGHISMEVAKMRPDIHVVLEDRPPVIEQAKQVSLFIRDLVLFIASKSFMQFWQENMPNSIKSGRIHFAGKFLLFLHPAI